MNHIHPTMQQALQFFTGASMPGFTVNPAFPHPDQDSDQVQAWSLGEAIRYAIKTLHDPKADQFGRNYAADQLEMAWCEHEEQA
jgi:hypothetical protein